MTIFSDPDRIYLDHNATTPISSVVKESVGRWLDHWGNASSIHFSGRGPKNALRTARKQIATAIGCHPLEVVLTSGGSESNNLALKGLYYGQLFSEIQKSRKQVIVSAVEHPSVIKVVEFLSQLGVQVEFIPVNRQGELDMQTYKSLLSEETAIVSVMYANNETGTIFPIAKMVKMAHEVGAKFHCDAVQALGKAVVDVAKWGVDSASFSGHKFYALKGAGALYVKKGQSLEPLIHGGAQERSRRAGTENILAISAFGQMMEELNEVDVKSGEIRDLRDYMETKILSQIDRVSITARESKRLCNTSSLVIKDVDGETLLMNLDMKGVSVSTGAACSSGSPEPSPVLLNMGLSRGEAQSSLRLSLGWGNSKEEIDHFVEILVGVVEKLRQFAEEEM